MTQVPINPTETHDLGLGWTIAIFRDKEGYETAVIGNPKEASIELGIGPYASLKALCRSTQALTHYIAIGPQCWGRSTTGSESAIRNMRKANSGRMPKDYAVWKCTESTYVNDMGGFTRNGFDAEPVKVFDTRGLEKK